MRGPYIDHWLHGLKDGTVLGGLQGKQVQSPIIALYSLCILPYNQTAEDHPKRLFDLTAAAA
jgi:hypothetical protein